mmetsp:Transcript_40891/g.102702  ORF Transcript_40891/g.102702 Transcript_40891/m.102702 type:complete len:187 (+) Transcript_40891:71-631(+)
MSGGEQFTTPDSAAKSVDDSTTAASLSPRSCNSLGAADEMPQQAADGSSPRMGATPAEAAETEGLCKDEFAPAYVLAVEESRKSEESVLAEAPAVESTSEKERCPVEHPVQEEEIEAPAAEEEIEVPAAEVVPPQRCSPPLGRRMLWAHMVDENSEPPVEMRWAQMPWAARIDRNDEPPVEVPLPC